MKTKMLCGGRILSLLLALCMLAGAFSGCGSDSSVSADKVKITLCEPGDSVSVHTGLQGAYLEEPYGMVLSYAQGKSERSKPEPICFTWEVEADESFGEPTGYIFRCGLKSDLSDATAVTLTEPEYKMTNFLLGQKYYWSVTAVYPSGEYTGEIADFTTETTAPRNLDVSGVTNVRDMGGWKTENGGTVKQGLLFRCGRLNENDSDQKKITDEGIQTMLGTLGIKSDIDLRKDGENGGITVSPLGDGVKYYHCPMGYDGDIMAINTEMLKNVLVILSDESNYPAIFHCSIGTDRTGMVAFVINALLGVSADDLYRDYSYSNFGDIGGSRDPANIKHYEETLFSAEGDSLSECTYNWLLGIGMTAEQLDSIIRILGPES